jgi:undecaprenyl-diphosphatase
MADELGSIARSSAERARAFLAARFDRKSQLGLGLTVSLAIFALAVWALSGLLDAVLDNETLVRVDGIVESWFHVHATPTGLAIFNVITQLGSPVVVVVVIAVALYLWRKHETLLLWNWIGANLGGKALEYVLKNSVHRSPAFLNGHSYSFPSGHTMGSTVCYLLLAYLIASRADASSRTSSIAIGTAVVIIVAVGFSRLYLGVHYPSDVLGGVAAGVAWLAMCGATRRFVAARLVVSRAS